MKLKRAVIALIIGLFFYLSLYSWNLKSGQLDKFAGYTGLEVVKWVLLPGEWAYDKSTEIIDKYVYLVGLKQLNDELSSQNSLMRLEIMQLKEKAAQSSRMRELLQIPPIEQWKSQGARIVAHRMGSAASLDSVIISKGAVNKIHMDAPVITPKGVFGRVVMPGLSASKVLLITDPNSRISVRGQTHRSTGLLVGGGKGSYLHVKYMKLNAPVSEGEVLVTSGLAGLYPAGLPVAKVVSIKRSDISLFLEVEAEPLEDMRDVEDVLVIDSLTHPNSISVEEH